MEIKYATPAKASGTVGDVQVSQKKQIVPLIVIIDVV